MLLLYQPIAVETGGSVGVSDEGLLESVLETAFPALVARNSIRPGEEKGARLGYNLISNHAVVDGNKRIGIYVMLTFLEINGSRLDCTNDDVVKAGLGVADSSTDCESLLAWVREYRIT